MKQEKLWTWASFVIVTAGILAGIWLLFTYALGLIAPFALAWLFSRLIRPLVNRMTKKQAMPRGLAAGILVCLFVGATAWLGVWGVSRGLSELGKLMEGMSQEDSQISRIFGNIQEIFSSVSSHIPFLQNQANHPEWQAFCQQLDSLVQQGATQMLKDLGQGVPRWVMGVASRLPSVLIFLTSFLFSCYYFSADDGGIWRGMLAYLPEVWQGRLEKLRTGLAKAAKKYVKAYLLLGGITFLEMFLGLTFLGVPYSFLIGWGIAIIDFLPLLGTGAVLVPWSIVMLIMGNFKLGFGLLVLFGISSLFRQLLEPKLLSSELGLHPLLSLFAVFVGWKLFGVWGMMLAPFAALFAKAVLQGNPSA